MPIQRPSEAYSPGGVPPACGTSPLSGTACIMENNGDPAVKPPPPPTSLPESQEESACLQGNRAREGFVNPPRYITLSSPRVCYSELPSSSGKIASCRIGCCVCVGMCFEGGAGGELTAVHRKSRWESRCPDKGWQKGKPAVGCRNARNGSRESFNQILVASGQCRPPHACKVKGGVQTPIRARPAMTSQRTKEE